MHCCEKPNSNFSLISKGQPCQHSKVENFAFLQLLENSHTLNDSSLPKTLHSSLSSTGQSSVGPMDLHGPS